MIENARRLVRRAFAMQTSSVILSKQQQQKDAYMIQYDLHFSSPPRLPAGCLHVSLSGADGYAVDGKVRVCGHECGAAWAKQYGGKWLTGEYTRYLAAGRIEERFFETRRPEDVVRASLAHLFNLIRSTR
jgi:hypothetical protein